MDGHQAPVFGDHEVPEEYNSFTEGLEDEDAFPCFIESSISESILRARKALKLLRIAQPDHSLLQVILHHFNLKWVWTEDEVKALWNGHLVPELAEINGKSDTVVSEEQHVDSKHYRNELTGFNVFDLTPGSHFQQYSSVPNMSSTPAAHRIEAFIQHFPDILPSLTPTLPHVTKLVLSPLVRHVDTLSSALVSVLLSPSTPLYLPAHLTLLRSYLLLASPSFKSRVVGALFSTSDDFSSTPQTIASHRARSRSRPRRKSKRWAVGLAKSLVDDGSWPPAGADLSFHLRTVIIDSLEDSRVLAVPEHTTEHNAHLASERIIEEAEWRVGFAIRDLAVVTGKEKWLDPLGNYHFLPNSILSDTLSFL